MAIAFTVLDRLQLPEPTWSVLAFVPGTVRVLALLAAGIPRAGLYLRCAWISRAGCVTLAATAILLLPTLAWSSGLTGWRCVSAVEYALA